MATFTETVSLHSTKFQPAFAIITNGSGASSACVGDLGFGIRQKARGSHRVIVPVPADGETEIARYVSLARGMASFAPDGRPPTVADAAASAQKKICEGAAELLLTNMRLCVLIMRGQTILGPVNEARGSVLALSLPYGDLDFVEVTRKKGAFGAVKESDVRVMSFAPPSGFVLEPHYRMDLTSDSPTKTSYVAFADLLVEAVCDFRLATETDERERARVRQVRAGHREENGLCLTAVLQLRA
jgi:hypothetical protein